MDDAGADIQEVTADDASGMLVCSVWGISEKARRGDSKVFPMFYVGEELDMCRDEGHVYICDVVGDCGKKRIHGFPISWLGGCRPGGGGPMEVSHR